MSSLNNDRSTYWRSLDELARNDYFRRQLENEFPGQESDEDLPSSVSRRRFLQLLGASAALAGMTACRWEDEKILPYAARPDGRAAGDLEEARRRARESARSPSAPSFAWPVQGRLSSRFGLRRGRPHDGIDVAASHGTPILAAEAGRVIYSGRLGSYGKVVIVKHAGPYRTVYAHASRLLVRKGEFVERGQKIAEVGSTGRSTGPHVHFEIRRAETPQNPLALLP